MEVVSAVSQGSIDFEVRDVHQGRVDLVQQISKAEALIHLEELSSARRWMRSAKRGAAPGLSGTVEPPVQSFRDVRVFVAAAEMLARANQSRQQSSWAA